MLPRAGTIAPGGVGRPCRRCPSCPASARRRAAPPNPRRGRVRARTGFWEAARGAWREAGARLRRPSPRGSPLRLRSTSRPAVPGSSRTGAALPLPSPLRSSEFQVSGAGCWHLRSHPQIIAAMAVSSVLGGAVRRREDRRLVTGAGQYTDDVRRDDALHAVFVRSTFAHARITKVDVESAAAMPGVVGVFLANDLGLAPRAAFPSPDTMARPPLASEVARFVGDAIAVVVARTRAEAVDGAAAVLVDYVPLPLVVDAAAALEAGAPVLPDAKGANLA